MSRRYAVVRVTDGPVVRYLIFDRSKREYVRTPVRGDGRPGQRLEMHSRSLADMRAASLEAER